MIIPNCRGSSLSLSAHSGKCALPTQAGLMPNSMFGILGVALNCADFLSPQVQLFAENTDLKLDSQYGDLL